MLRRIRDNKDHKSLVENFLSLSAIQVVSLLLPLIILPYVLRTIGLEKYGITVLAWSLINYFTSITDFSFKITATRDVAIFRNNRKKLSIIYSKVMIIQSFLQLLSYIVILIVVFSYKPFYDEKLVFFLTMPYLLGNTIFPDWFFQGIEEMKYITFINVSIKVLFTVFVFVLIKSSSDYWIYPLLQTLGFLVSGIIGQIILLRKYKIRFYWLKRKTIIRNTKENFPIFINQFLPNLYNNTSTFLLGILTNNSLVGIYDAIRKVTNLGGTLIDLISRVFFPFLNRRKNAFDKYRKLMTILGAGLAIAIIVFYKIILWYLHIQYEYSFAVIFILAIGLFFLSQYDVYGINYFIVNRKDKIVMKNTLIASLTGFALAFPLIHFWGIIGAALTITIARGYMGAGLYFKYKTTK